MDVKEPTWKEVKGFCQKRQDQAKLPDQMEYLLQCSRSVQRYFYVKEIMATFPTDLEEKNKTSMMVRGRGMFCAERKNLKTINQFKTISLLNVEGKYSWQYKQSGYRVLGGQ